MNYHRYLIKQALLRPDIDLERAIVSARDRRDSAGQQLSQMMRLQDLASLSRRSPYLAGAITGLPSAALGSIPGAIFGGPRGAAIGAAAGGIMGGLVGAGRPERALGVLDEARRGAPVEGRAASPRMRKVIRGLITEG